MAVARALVQHDEDMRARLGEEELPKPDSEGNDNPLWSADLRHRTKQAFAAAPRFILLDFRYVLRADVSAVWSPSLDAFLESGWSPTGQFLLVRQFSVARGARYGGWIH